MEAEKQPNSNLKRGSLTWGSRENGTGKSGNPNGRPTKDFTLTSLLKQEINKIPEGEKKGRTWRQLLVQAWLTGSLKNPALLKELLERLEGRVMQPVGGENGQPIILKVVYEERRRIAKDRI